MSKIQELRLGSGTKNPLNGGLCLNEETSLEIGQSPYDGLLNMCLDNGDTLTKRKGQSYLYLNSLGNNSINAVFSNYKGKTIIAYSNKIYTQIGSNEPILIYTGITDKKGTFFMYNETLYFKNDGSYVQYDGENVTEVKPYIPRISINKKPNGTGAIVDESWNMLGNGFKDSFNGDGTSINYKLTHNNIDDKDLTCVVNGVPVTDFTVDREKGTVTFSSPPSEGNNNVEITAYKSFPKLVENIIKCDKAIEFSNRIFITGNSNLPNYYFAGGLTDSIQANYFPQKFMYTIGGSDKAITGFKVHQNKLIVFKENMVCTVESSVGLDNTASFPIQFLNTEVGCDIPNSIQVLNNNIVFANTYGGVYVIASAYITGEKSVLPISNNINGDYVRNGLLQEANLKEAISVDHDFKYWLCVNDKAYVLDYREVLSTKNQKENRWFVFDNINANCFFIRDNELMYGCKNNGKIVKFVNSYSDFGKPIKSIWKSKLIDFGYPEWQKMLTEMWATFSNKSDAKIKLKCYSDNGTKIFEIDINTPTFFSWEKFSWEKFSWKVELFDKTIKKKIRVKKISYFQLSFENNVLNEGLSIKNIVLNYRLIRRVK